MSLTVIRRFLVRKDFIEWEREVIRFLKVNIIVLNRNKTHKNIINIHKKRVKVVSLWQLLHKRSIKIQKYRRIISLKTGRIVLRRFRTWKNTYKKYKTLHYQIRKRAQKRVLSILMKTFNHIKMKKIQIINHFKAATLIKVSI